MAETPTENNEVFTNFSNPNYQLNTEDALNSNTSPPQFYDDKTLYDDGTDGIISAAAQKTAVASRRKQYANIDLDTMGVQLSPGSKNGMQLHSPTDSVLSPSSEGTLSVCSGVTTPSAASSGGILEVEHTDTDDDMNPYAESRGTGFLGYYASLEMSAAKVAEEESEALLQQKESEEKTPKDSEQKQESFDDKTKDINSPDSNDSGIQSDVQHIHGPINEDIYALPNKQGKSEGKTNHAEGEEVSAEPLYAEVDKSKKRERSPDTAKEEDTEENAEESLPPGWERHEDEDGAYYWHIKSGTIQRDPPPPAPPAKSTDINSPPTPSSQSTVHEEEEHQSSQETPAKQDITQVQIPLTEDRSSKLREDYRDEGEKPIKFAVRSLGWVRIAEEDLTPERSSKAVNKCIVDLSLGRNDINDVVGRWGDGKDLFMDLDSENLTLIDPKDMSMLNLQPIQSIRVWGVGRDNGRERDFAYVARDRISRKHMCHVFRCDTPARQIANTLHDICRKIMMERSIQQAMGGVSHRTPSANRPNNLPNLEKSTDQAQNFPMPSLYRGNMTSFPTPMEEPKKVLRCHYLGTARVPTPTGNKCVEMINAAMDKIYTQVPPEKWVFVSVAVAPSTITITEHKNPENVLGEARVRFLSFMGIARKNVKMCSFITHSAQDQYVAHVFHCEPSAGALCKTIEAACKLRYQKCLDAHPATPTQRQDGTANGKGIKQTLKQGVQCMWGSIRRKSKS